MRFSTFSSVFLPLLYILTSASAKEKSIDELRAESLFSVGTSLFSPIKEGETENIQARWIPFDDKESKTFVWDNSKAKAAMGVVVADTGAWVFRISKDSQAKLLPYENRQSADSLYKSDKFSSKLAYPLFGYGNQGEFGLLPNSLSGLHVRKADYRKAWIISPPKNGDIVKKSLITALAWTMTEHTGLNVQWMGLRAPGTKSKKPFVLHIQPKNHDGDNGDDNSRDFEIFDSGLRLLTATITSSNLQISQYAEFDQETFSGVGENSSKVKGDKPDPPDIADELWKGYPNLVNELEFVEDAPKAQYIPLNQDLGSDPTIVRHLNKGNQANSIMILVVTSMGSWILALSQTYLTKLKGIKNTSVDNIRLHDDFKPFKEAVLSRVADPNSWAKFAEHVSCGASLIDIVVLSGYSNNLKSQDLTYGDLIKAILLEMRETSPSSLGFLYDLKNLKIPFFTFELKNRGLKEELDRFVLRNYASQSLIDSRGNEVGPGSFFEYYYGNRILIKGAIALDEYMVATATYQWSDKPTDKFPMA